MKEKCLKTISLVLIVINTLAMFLLVGMPKSHTNRLHFTDDPIQPYYYDAVYAPVKDMTVSDYQGNVIEVTKDTRIGVSNLILTIEESLEGKMYSILLIDPSNKALDLKMEDLNDDSRFEDITEQVRNGEKSIYEEGLKKYKRYMLKERLWFLFPWEYFAYYIVAAIPALLAFALWYSIHKRNKYLLVSISLILLSFVKIVWIVYFYANPTFCR